MPTPSCQSTFISDPSRPRKRTVLPPPPRPARSCPSASMDASGIARLATPQARSHLSDLQMRHGKPRATMSSVELSSHHVIEFGTRCANWADRDLVSPVMSSQIVALAIPPSFRLRRSRHPEGRTLGDHRSHDPAMLLATATVTMLKCHRNLVIHLHILSLRPGPPGPGRGLR